MRFRRSLEVGVFRVALIARREHGAGRVRRMLGDECERASAHAIAGIGAREAFDHEHVVALVCRAGADVKAVGGVEAAAMDHGRTQSDNMKCVRREPLIQGGCLKLCGN